MKKNFKKLVLNKSTLSNLDASKVSGGQAKESVLLGGCMLSKVPAECELAANTRKCNNTKARTTSVSNCPYPGK